MPNVWQIFIQFLALGFTSFGGPAAHMAYFRQQFVVRKQWLSEAHYGQLIALSQFLPGPGSSQVGFAVGYHRGGLAGALAAFIGFSAPSFVLMYVLAVYGQSSSSMLMGLTTGLKLLAVVVVADAVVGMYGSFCKSMLHRCLAALTAAAVLLLGGVSAQLVALLLAGVVGAMVVKAEPLETTPAAYPRWLPLVLFVGFAVALPVFAASHAGVALLDDFYRAGSLVFGGGHVVLPLLQTSVGEAVGDDRFLMAYAAAQAVPGPMFSLAAFLGADLLRQQALLGAVLAVVGIFAPGFLLVLAFQSHWQALSARPRVAGAGAAVNAAVVGLLAAAFFKPVFISAVVSLPSLVVVVVAYAILVKYRPPIVAMVAAFAMLGLVLQYLA